MGHVVKLYFKILIMVILSVLAGFGILCAVYALPAKGQVAIHAQESIQTFEKEGEPFSWGYNNITAVLDNFTDSVMVSKAIFPGTGNIINDALQNPSYGHKGMSSTTSLIKVLHGEKEGEVIENYGRYWHGYLLYLKPLLFAFSVGEIRLLNAMVQLMIVFYLFDSIGRKFGGKYKWAFLLTYLSLNPISLALSFQYSSMFYITALSGLWLVRTKKNLLENSFYLYVFAAIGIGTAFFDFLTYPLVSYGIPMVLLLLIVDKNHGMKAKWVSISLVIHGGLSWALGYGGMYLGKWLLSWTFFGYGAFQEAVGQAMYRMSNYTVASELVNASPQSYSAIWVIALNVFTMMQNPVCWLALLYVSMHFFKQYILREKEAPLRVMGTFGMALLLIAISPFVWYSVLSNHSCLHFWFTHRELSISIFAMSCYFLKKWDGVNQ